MKFCIYQLDIVGEGCAAPGAVRAGRLMWCDVILVLDQTRWRHSPDSEDTPTWAHGDMRTVRLIRYSPSICVRPRRCQGPCCAVLQHCHIYTPQLPPCCLQHSSRPIKLITDNCCLVCDNSDIDVHCFHNIRWRPLLSAMFIINCQLSGSMQTAHWLLTLCLNAHLA